jgi:hypothetical protein
MTLIKCTFLCRILYVLRNLNSFLLTVYHLCVPTMAGKNPPTSNHSFLRLHLIQTLVFHMKGGEGVGSGYSIEVKLSSRNRTKETGSDTAFPYPVSESFRHWFSFPFRNIQCNWKKYICLTFCWTATPLRSFISSYYFYGQTKSIAHSEICWKGDGLRNMSWS